MNDYFILNRWDMFAHCSHTVSHCLALSQMVGRFGVEKTNEKNI